LHDNLGVPRFVCLYVSADLFEEPLTRWLFLQRDVENAQLPHILPYKFMEMT